MVTKSQYKILKEYLKGDYVKDVQQLLIKRNVKSRGGACYGDSMIRNVLNGTNKNHQIKDALLQVYIDRKNKAEVFGKLLSRNKWLKSKIDSQEVYLYSS